MKRESAKAAARRRKYKPARDEYRNQLCQVCRYSPARDVHEIARGIYRAEAYCERVCWLAVCGDCHDLLGDYSRWPIERQLAMKLLSDPEHFDLVKVNRIRGRADGAIVLADIVCFLKVV